MHFLILGTGYVGKALLKEPFCEFTATTTSKQKTPGIKALGASPLLLQGEQITEETLSSFDGIIVLVAPKEGSLDSYKKTYIGTAKAIKQSLKKRDKPFYLLQASSTGVHASTEKGKILQEAEDLYKSASSSFVKVCILRLGGIYGPERDLLTRAKILSGKTLPGSGDTPTNHIHLDDIVRAIAFCSKKRLTGTFDLVNDDHRSRKILYHSLCASLQIPPPLFQEDVPCCHGSNKFLSNNPIKQTGFTFTHPFCHLIGD